jgi:hypothetical protein
MRVVVNTLFILAAMWLAVCKAGPLESQTFQVQVIADQLNVRPEPPKFSISTLFTLKYTVQPSLYQLKKDSILVVHETMSVGDKAEWLKITYKAPDGKTVSGWVYAGREGSWVNVKRIQTQTGLGSHYSEPVSKFSLLGIFITDAHASNTDASVAQNEAAGTRAAAPYVLLVILFNLVLFLSAMFVAKKIINDSRFIMFTGVCTLLIEGVVTETGLWGWLHSIV